MSAKIAKQVEMLKNAGRRSKNGLPGIRGLGRFGMSALDITSSCQTVTSSGQPAVFSHGIQTVTLIFPQIHSFPLH